LMKTHLGSLLPSLPLRLPQLRNSTQHSDQNVRVNSPLVRFIDDHHAVLREEEIGSKFAEENTVRHEDELRVWRGSRGVTDAMGNEGRVGSEAEFCADTSRRRECGDSSRLSDRDHAGVVCEKRVRCAFLRSEEGHVPLEASPNPASHKN
jgi:hypothetical protein